MMVTLIETYRIFNMTLPDKVKGRFWITDVDSFGNDRKLISVEADEGSWVLKGSDSAVICDTHNRIADDTVLEDNVFYNVRILEENEEGYVYAQPDDIGRQTFDKYVFRDNAELTIGRDSDNTVCINNRYVSSHHAVIKYMDGVWTIEDKNSTNGTFVNNRRTSLQELRPGDVLFIVGFKLIIGSNYIAFNNPGNTVKWDNNILQNMKPQEFDGVGKTKTTEIRPQFFYRAPRFKRDISTLKFKVDMPPAKEAQNNMPMAMIMGPSITMGMASMSSGAFSVINAINSGGNVMSVIPTAAMSVSMLLGMVMWPIITKKHEKKESQRCEAERQKLYKEYLFSLRDTIRREIENQEQILRENNISIDEASDRIINRLGNLWERNINQDDFLSISLGNGNIQMCEEIQFPDRKFSVNKDNLINDMFALANEPRELKSVPVVHSFKNNKVTGIVGENDRKVKDFVMSLIIKIAALHSYDELKLVFILSEKDDDIVNVVKWFPHTWDDEHVKRYIATNLREAKEISSELEQEFYNRRELRNEDIAAPYYLIISTNTTTVAHPSKLLNGRNQSEDICVKPKTGGTTMLGLDENNGGTTILSEAEMRMCYPKIIRIKTGEEADIYKDDFVIGQAEGNADFCISDNSAISREHVHIIKDGNKYYLIDYKSTNGTYIQNRKIEKNKYAELTDGIVFRLANEEFRFKI